MSPPFADKFCILGAGTSGLAVLKNFRQRGIACDCLEREDALGGNWCYGKPASSIYASTHLISSKRLTEYTDFPLPEHYPEYPGHELVLEYLNDYARHFGLLRHIEFNTGVERLETADTAGWHVTLSDGQRRTYRGVVIANGHNWDPRFPDYPGVFEGEVLHSASYKTPDVLTGRRVLVVGGGNSGCDLAVEAAVHARRAVLSMRRAYPILPKFFKGKPIDACGETLLRWRMPLAVRRLFARMVVRWVLGPPEMVGWPRPDHRLFESHPIINSRLYDRLGHGDLAIKPEVARLDGQRVQFVDGTEEPFDLIVYTTGFKVSFPFIDRAELNWRNGAPDLYLNIFHPQRDDLFCAGLIQPDSGQWGLVDCQAQLIAEYLLALEHHPQRAARFRKLKQTSVDRWPGRGRYLDSPRHRLEVEHFSYRRGLQRQIARLA